MQLEFQGGIPNCTLGVDEQEVKSERILGENRASGGVVKQQEVNQYGAGGSYRNAARHTLEFAVCG